GVAACWGKNDVGQLGNGGTGASSGIATAVTGGHTFLQISAGGRHTCAVDDAHELWCWGANDFGQLGDSGVSGAYAKDPVAIWPGHGWRNVAAGDDFTCAMANATGAISVYCWGRNDHQQLGPSHTADSLSMVPVTATALVGNSPIGVFAGGAFACAAVTFADPGQGLQCWGANEHGQLGRGIVSVAEASSAPPLAVAGLPDLELPILGRTHACATTREDSHFIRRLVCWGENIEGRFGIGRTGGDEPTPLFLEAEY
ncbi:MAG TPA: hypothetical protein VG712_01065, partial [Gemmatimonadales bacterium]|nr:hypothetical protein [Gemmatimonadales bacterium]